MSKRLLDVCLACGFGYWKVCVLVTPETSSPYAMKNHTAAQSY